MTRLVRSGLVVSLLVGCVNANNVPSVRLYEGPEEPATEVATLVGDVEEVDGQSVSARGHHFALLPGCHVVTNVTTWGGNDSNAAVMAHLPQIPFAIDMKAGLTYVVRIGIVGPVGEGGKLEITAKEQDAAGNVLRQFEPRGAC